MIHIQNKAPAPPAEIAATTPTKFPIPTRVAVETIKACKPEIESFSDFLLCEIVIRNISGNKRKGRKRVRMVKYKPAGIKIMTNRDKPRLLPFPKGIVIKSPHKH